MERRNTTQPLARHRLFRSRDLDEARMIVAGKFCDHRLDRASRQGRFDACHHRAEGHNASLNFIRYGADVEIEPGELGSFYLIQIPVRGRAEIDNGAGRIATDHSVGSILNPHRHTCMRWRDGCAQILLQIDMGHLNRLACRMTGRHLAEPVTFDTAIDRRRAGIGQWVSQLQTCFALADRRLAFTGHTTHSQILVEERLIEEFLRLQPSSISTLLDKPTDNLANRHVRRAVQYMRDHLAEPITIRAVADAVGVTVRSLQMGFRKELDLTPLQFLHEERFREARHLLAHASDTDQIGDICARAGFGHFGRFSVEYRKRFGHSPHNDRGDIQRR